MDDSSEQVRICYEEHQDAVMEGQRAVQCYATASKDQD